ncbi:lipocalin-like domain-containing protein [Pontivivens insulae]|uniref:AttH domain-containing protein n=1 Tax=Pontivivens insulae TaxID=1639689 RepID=A0A2R8AEC7_9RHOB|nr:lipocalin-like domain-containing protein [Pontivivens insulae]RED14361.1 putative secreted hydrolase [Pontivivens insulae]SPF30438.1 hypothetical protein POI8812_02775 [Pontivivens insulae]
MNAERFFPLLFAMLLLPVAGLGQGFAGLGTDAGEGFAVPDPQTRFSFPDDHGPHPDYRIEWWYLTANLQDEAGRDYGIQWTLFRSALAPGEAEAWSSPQVWMGHAGLTTPEAHFVGERLARGGIGQAGVVADPFAAWIDDWSFEGATPANASLGASGDGFAYALELSSDAPFVPQGEDGYSVKSAEGQASYYYSQPFYTAEGTLTVGDQQIAVTGTAWLDREWSSQPLSDNQTGWDWFSLSLEDGHRVMAFRLRQTDGTAYHSGTWITPEGTPQPLAPDALRFTPLATTRVERSGATLPTRWRIEIPQHALDITVDALQPQSWMETLFPYWEGPIAITGSHTGRGYLEMTGYDEDTQ